MAKVTYTPGEGMPDTTDQYGYAFAKGKPVEVFSAKHLKKFVGIPYFKVADDAPAGKSGKRAM